jgi:hypothetical protein
MSTEINIKERGWSLRKARPEDGEGEGWLWEKKDGAKTRTSEAPGEGKREALRIEEEIDAAASGATAAEASEDDGASSPMNEVQSSAYAEDSQPLEETTTQGAGGSLFGEVGVAPLSQEILPSRITRHPLTSMRAGERDESYISELEGVLERGGRFKDPVVLFYESAVDTYWLADGNYRTEAASRKNRPLDADIRPGGLRDAILYAAGANAEHGRGRTNDDKRLAVVTLLLDTEWSRESDTTLADLAGHVSQPFVGKIQAWLEKVVALAAEDADGELSDDEYVSRTGAPDGLVTIFRELPAESREALAHNVMGRAEARKTSDGRTFAPSRSAPADEPQLFDDVPTAETATAPNDESAARETRADEHEEGARADEDEAAERLPQFHRLTEFLQPRPEGAHTDELTAAGFTMHEIGEARRARAIERLENGRCFYAWKPEDIVGALRAHGGRMSRRALEELGCQSHAITGALGEGYIRQPETGIFEPADESLREESRPPAQESASPSAASPARESAATVRNEIEQNRREPQRASVSEMLKGRKCFVGLNWIQGMTGSVNVTVSVDGDMADAVRELVEERELHLPPRLLAMIEQHIKDSKPGAAKATEATLAARASSKSSKSQPAVAKKSAAKKAPTKAASKKSARATKLAAKPAAKGASKSSTKAAKGGSKSSRSTRA